MTLFSLFQTWDLPQLLFQFSFLVSVSLATLGYLMKGNPRLVKKIFPLLVVFLIGYGLTLACDIMGIIEMHYLLQVFPNFSFDSVTHRSLLAPFPFLSGLTVLIILFVHRRHLHEKHAFSYITLSRMLLFLIVLAMGMLTLESYL